MPLGIRKTCLSLVFLGSFALPRASAQTWRPIGPPGGDARTLAVDPSNPQRVYLGTTDGHLFVSRDSGRRWERLRGANLPRNSVITSIIVDPRDSSALIVSAWTPEPEGEGGGVYFSLDGGASWRESGLAGHGLRALVESSSHPDVLLAGGLDGVFRSTDFGRTWSRVTPAGDPELRNFDSLAVDPRNPDVIYAGTFHLPWKTLDGGAHWFPIHEGMIDDSDVLSLAVDPAYPQRIFASACSGLYRSADAGMHWKKIQGIPFSSRRTPVIQLDATHPGTYFAGTTEGLWRTADDGLTWQRVSPGDWVVNSLAFTVAGSERGSGLRLLAGTEQLGVLASDDGGEHFSASNDGFGHRQILSLAMDTKRPGHIAAVLAGAGAPDATVETEDGGESWTPLARGLAPETLRHIFSSPAGWLAALASGGLARFDSSLQTWSRAGVMQEIGGTNPPHAPLKKQKAAPAFSALVNDLAFADAGWFAATEEGLFVSRDEGSSWSSVPFGPAGLPADSVSVSRDGRRIRLVSWHAMLFSEDAGASWHWHDLPFGSGGVTRVQHVDDAVTLAASPAGLFVSHDSGESWRLAGAGLPAQPVLDLLVRPGLWIVSLKGGGIYLSRDHGLNWSRVRGVGPQEQPMAAGRVDVLLADTASGLLYAGTTNDGLYVLALPASPAVASNVPPDQ